MDDIVCLLKGLCLQKERLEQQIAECEQSLLSQHHIEIEESLASKDEPYGDVTIGKIKFKIPKYIKWDNVGLLEIAAEISAQGGNPHDWINYKLSVTEIAYKALPEILKDKFSRARKISGGKINISFKE